MCSEVGRATPLLRFVADIGRVDQDIRVSQSEVESCERDLVCARRALEVAEEKKKEAEVMSVVVNGTVQYDSGQAWNMGHSDS